LDRLLVAPAPLPRPGPPLPAAPVPSDGAVSLVYKGTEQANIVVGARAASLLDSERFVVDVLNGLLGEGMSSRLFLELRENQGLAYDVHSFTVRLIDSGALAMYVGCDPARARQALAAAVGELRRLASEPVRGEELGRAVSHLKGRLLLGLESTSSMSRYLGQQELSTGEILTAQDVMDRLDTVTAGAVQEVAGSILKGGLRCAIVGPFRDPQSFYEVVTS
ncbi:MAG: M16 family metallopeptidase, partial [Candidatus Dormibacteria bacterium]